MHYPESASEIAIRDLRHVAGTYEIYESTLAGVTKVILHQSDELGMSDHEALNIIRVLDMIRYDLRAIAGRDVKPLEEVDMDTIRTARDKISSTFEEAGIADSHVQ